ncbi:hypothetical protein NBRC111894_1734 [Sporolactobacillus inulinus]|uniref:Uncharacterized protein n=1 Tax=Sporolactobacillus inulinus TaxID=2078 RepID=A0A4Y1ZAX6_9BACL|nr:hypothetical protein NBRC111894_1734 [Sporolactobacillus inulinus]
MRSNRQNHSQRKAKTLAVVTGMSAHLSMIILAARPYPSHDRESGIHPPAESSPQY